MKNLIKNRSRDGKRASYVYQPVGAGAMVRIEIQHRDGGMNFFSGATETRGIEVVVTEVKVSDGLVEYTPAASGNARIQVAETARYSERRLDEVAALLDDAAPSISAGWKTDRRAQQAVITGIADRLRVAA